VGGAGDRTAIPTRWREVLDPAPGRRARDARHRRARRRRATPKLVADRRAGALFVVGSAADSPAGDGAGRAPSIAIKGDARRRMTAVRLRNARATEVVAALARR
jgi:hypothetical protein